MANLYIDFTDTYFSKKNTGIQRVVRNIVSRKDFFIEHDFLEVFGVVQVCGNFYRFELGDARPFRLRKGLFLLASKLRNVLDACFDSVGAMRGSKRGTDAHNSSKNAHIDLDESRPSLKIKVLVLLRKILRFIHWTVEYYDSLFMREQKVFWKEYDVLFLPDAFWPDYFSISAVGKVKARGVKIVTMIHDIFPITHSYLVGEKNNFDFKRKFKVLGNLTDAYIFNSKFTQLEVLQYINKVDRKSVKSPSDYFHLGADFERPLEHDFPFGHQKMYLMVGTIEPKKNHLYVLRAFHSYWDSGGGGRLVIVGKIGWKCDEVLDVINSSPYLDKNLFCFNQVSDRELVKFYSNCSALIFSSIVEGFGLPVVEAMGYKKTVLASDIPVFREVAGDYPFYFDLESNDSLIDLLQQLETGMLASGRPVPELLSWDDSIRQLSSKLGALCKHLV